MTPEQKQKLEQIANYCQQKSNEYRKTNLRLSDKWGSYASRAASAKFVESVGYERFVEFVNGNLDPENSSETGAAVAAEIAELL